MEFWRDLHLLFWLEPTLLALKSSRANCAVGVQLLLLNRVRNLELKIIVLVLILVLVGLGHEGVLGVVELVEVDSEIVLDGFVLVVSSIHICTTFILVI